MLETDSRHHSGEANRKDTPQDVMNKKVLRTWIQLPRYKIQSLHRLMLAK